MKYFNNIELPTFPKLLSELELLINDKVISWTQNQICINSVVGQEDNYKFGVGSLVYDWDKKSIIKNKDGTEEVIIPNRTDIVSEYDFKVLCTQFKGTVIEELYNVLNSKYKLGRVRFMLLPPKSCLSWHTDESQRLHYPLKTSEACKMVIEDEVQYMPAHTWWHTNTTFFHTAFNASMQSRIHLVAVTL